LLAPRWASDGQGAEKRSVVWLYYIIIIGRLRFRRLPTS
jgi:hypothetical protein